MINLDKSNHRPGGTRYILRALVSILGLLALGLLIYIILLPFYPSIKYKISETKNQDVNYKDIDAVKKMTEEMINKSLPENKKITIAQKEDVVDDAKVELSASENNDKNSPATTSDTDEKKSAATISGVNEPVSIPNTLIIPKIGVNIPIIESDNEEYGLNHGAWKLPKSSTPEEIGNMILTGHRFKYLPPSNLTFYLFNKLEEGDIASVIWNNETYFYKINEIKIVPADDISILKQSKTPILTMYTCDPIYSTKNRLVVISELIK